MMRGLDGMVWWLVKSWDGRVHPYRHENKHEKKTLPLPTCMLPQARGCHIHDLRRLRRRLLLLLLGPARAGGVAHVVIVLVVLRGHWGARGYTLSTDSCQPCLRISLGQHAAPLPACL